MRGGSLRPVPSPSSAEPPPALFPQSFLRHCYVTFRVKNLLPAAEFLSVNHPSSSDRLGLLLCEDSRRLGIFWVIYFRKPSCSSGTRAPPGKVPGQRLGWEVRAQGRRPPEHPAPGSDLRPLSGQHGTEQSWPPRPGKRRHVFTRETMK